MWYIMGFNPLHLLPYWSSNCSVFASGSLFQLASESFDMTLINPSLYGVRYSKLIFYIFCPRYGMVPPTCVLGMLTLVGWSLVFGFYSIESQEEDKIPYELLLILPSHIQDHGILLNLFCIISIFSFLPLWEFFLGS